MRRSESDSDIGLGHQIPTPDSALRPGLGHGSGLEALRTDWSRKLNLVKAARPSSGRVVP
jgi:hypothetical protein